MATRLEATIVAERLGGAEAGEALRMLIATANIRLIAVEQNHLEAAQEGWRRFGKGNHPARLNFVDCFSYALAKVTGEPLLYKGNDFSKTDVKSALPLS